MVTQTVITVGIDARPPPRSSNASIELSTPGLLEPGQGELGQPQSRDDRTLCGREEISVANNKSPRMVNRGLSVISGRASQPSYGIGAGGGGWLVPFFAGVGEGRVFFAG